MKSVRIILISITSLLTLHGVLARTTHKKKNEDRYMTIENDISGGAPILPIEGGYKDPEDNAKELTDEEINNMYGTGGIYGAESGYDTGNPYYYYAYNPRVIYDPKSPFFIGNDYDLTRAYPAEYASDTYSDPDPYSESDHGEPEGTIISKSYGSVYNPEASEYGEVYEQTEEPTMVEDLTTPEPDQPDEDTETEESRPEPYWVNPETDASTGGFFNNYMMGIPAQLQSFPFFNPEYYQSEYREYERIAAENERKREELEAQGLEANTVDNPENFPRGGRVKRGFVRMLNLRDKNEDGHVSGKGINGKSANVVLNADCRGGYGGRRPDPRNDGGNNGSNGVGDVANGVADAAGTAQNAVGQVAGAAGDAVNAATDAAENLRLANGRRTNNRRNTNNRNNGRRVE